MRTLLRISYVALVAALLVAAYQFTGRNTEPVHLEIFGWSTREWPLWTVVLCAFAAGFVLASLLLGTRLFRSSLVARRYRKAVGSLEAEVHQLRNVPLAEGGAPAEPGARRG